MMLSYNDYLTEEQKSRPLTAGGKAGDYHFDKYIKPHIASGKQTNLKLVNDHPHGKAGDSVYIHAHKQDDKGAHHVTVSTDNKSHFHVKQSELRKPSKPSNKGHEFESKFVHRLKSAGIMPKTHSGAGSSAGSDATFLNKKVSHKEHGKGGKRRIFRGETKGKNAAWGQLTIHHSDEKGWHIKDENRKRRPRYAEHVEKAGVLDYMNKTEPNPKSVPEGQRTVKSHVIHHPNMEPANAYLRDHHVHVVHTEKGTYTPHHKDPTGYGFPRLRGEGMFKIRQKTQHHKPGEPIRSRTVQFAPRNSKSPVASPHDLNKDEHLHKFAAHLGHSSVKWKHT